MRQNSSIEKLRSDLKRAGIEAEDQEGRRLDSHALRHTYATNLARAGVVPRVAMEMLRHSDMRLTNTTYTDALLLPLAEAVEKLPTFGGADTPIHSPKSGARGRDVACDGTANGQSDFEKTLVVNGQSHALAQSGIMGQMEEMVPQTERFANHSLGDHRGTSAVMRQDDALEARFRTLKLPALPPIDRGHQDTTTAVSMATVATASTRQNGRELKAVAGAPHTGPCNRCAAACGGRSPRQTD